MGNLAQAPLPNDAAIYRGVAGVLRIVRCHVHNPLAGILCLERIFIPVCPHIEFCVAGGAIIPIDMRYAADDTQNITGRLGLNKRRGVALAATGIR